jgi:sugar-phosphatase
MIKGVIFDMDGLLVNTEPLWQQAETQIFQQMGAPLTPEMCKTMMGKRMDEVVAHWCDEFNIRQPSHHEIILDIQDRMEVLIRNGIELMPGVKITLDYFFVYNYSLALASSSANQLIRAVMDTTGIEKYFQVVRSGECEIYGKPHPSIFLSALKEMKLKPHEVVVFEDSFYGGIAAKAANMRTILIPGKEEQNHSKFGFADKVLSSMEEFSEEVLYSE